jgi:ABC-2 type transport system permease protein/oleandomycin transport system permease protein
MSTATLTPTGRANVFSNTFTIARRNLLHIKATPEQLVEMSIQPIMFLVLFVYVFGGAIAGSSAEYLQFALPGILVQSVSFLPFTTAIALNVDFQRGVIDRFRSPPIGVRGDRRRSWPTRAHPLEHPDHHRVRDGARFRFEGGTAGALRGRGARHRVGLTMCWPMAFIGITARTTESVNTWASDHPAADLREHGVRAGRVHAGLAAGLRRMEPRDLGDRCCSRADAGRRGRRAVDQSRGLDGRHPGRVRAARDPPVPASRLNDRANRQRAWR